MTTANPIKSKARTSSIEQDKSGNNNAYSKMYGDIVILLWWSIVVPIHGYELWMMDPSDPIYPGAKIAEAGLVAAWFTTALSLYTKQMFFSRLSFACNIFAMCSVNLLEFPFPGECAITPMMIGGTLVGVIANVSLPFEEKMARLPIYFLTGSCVCMLSPYCVYSTDTRPILGGVVMVEMVALTVAENFGGVQKALKQLERIEMNVAHLARIVLASLFLYHITMTLLQLEDRTAQYHKHQQYIYDGGDEYHGPHNEGAYSFHYDPEPHEPRMVNEMFFVLSRAAVIACVGVAATGAFQEEIDSKERAERKAKEESMMAKAMADSMTMLTHELRTPLQGIMGATSMLLQQKNDRESGDSDNSYDHESDDSLKLIMASSGLLLNLINNMLDVKRVAEGMMEEFPLTLFPASEPIRDAIGFCKPLASISNVRLVADYGNHSDGSTTRHAVVRSNALRLQQVLINLISNAIKYTNTDGDDEAVINVSLRITTIEDADWRMKRALASSRNASTPEPESDTVAEGNHQNTKPRDHWSEKKRNEKVLLFGVSDGGPGIDNLQADRLFRRFGRLDNKPKNSLGGNKVGQPSGTGLGLHLCQLFVQRMDGQIWATNNNSSKGGATFFFCLPLGMERQMPLHQPTKQPSLRKLQRKLTKRREEQRHKRTMSRDSSESQRSKVPTLIECENDSITLSSNDSDSIDVYQRRLLVVDDTLINRKILSRMLKKIGFTKFTTVSSGQVALKELYKQRYDLVITDLQMPGMSGTELSEAIHGIQDDYFQTPVVVGLTADTSTETVESCKASGMVDVIHKPITVDELSEFFERRISVLIDENRSGYLEP